MAIFGKKKSDKDKEKDKHAGSHIQSSNPNNGDSISSLSPAMESSVKQAQLPQQQQPPQQQSTYSGIPTSIGSHNQNKGSISASMAGGPVGSGFVPHPAQSGPSAIPVPGSGPLGAASERFLSAQCVTRTPVKSWKCTSDLPCCYFCASSAH